MTDDGQTQISCEQSKEDAKAPDESDGLAACDAGDMNGISGANGIGGEGADAPDNAPKSNGHNRSSPSAARPINKPPSPTALQDMFLNGLRRENIDVVVYLCDGTQERGTVRGFDTFTILLENRNSGKSQLIYKHAVARIFPTRNPAMPFGGERAKK